MAGSLRRGAVAALACAALAGCETRESPEAARDRVAEAFLMRQIADLGTLVKRAEEGDLVTRDRVSIGIAEEVVKALLDASLPQEKTLKDRVRVRLESAQAYFRGNNAALVFQAAAQGLGPVGASARLELGGALESFRIDQGRLIGDVKITHFKLLESTLGDVANDALETLVGENLDELADLIPTLEIPVSLEQVIKIDGLDEGVVTVKPGSLSLAMTVAEVIPVNQRLWILLELKAGPWQKAAPQKPAAKPAAVRKP
jgi:hypothetical protein